MNQPIRKSEVKPKRVISSMGFIYIALTVFFTVYGQMVLKWQVRDLELPTPLGEKLVFLVQQYANPWVFSALVAGFLASMTWMAAMTQFTLSFAYPFTSAAFVLVMFLSAIFFQEALNIYKLVGTIVIMIGLVIMTQGM